MILLGRRAPRVKRWSSAPANASHTAVLASAATLDDLIVYLHRRTGSNPAAGSGFTNMLNIGTACSCSYGPATAGQTNVVGDATENSDSIAAIAYGGVRRGTKAIANLSSEGTATSATATFPTLTLKDPGRSWVLGILFVNTQSPTLNSVTAGQVQVTGGSGFVHFMDSNGPVKSWSGVQGTLSASATWRAYSMELMSL